MSKNLLMCLIFSTLKKLEFHYWNNCASEINGANLYSARKISDDFYGADLYVAERETPHNGSSGIYLNQQLGIPLK